MAYSKLRCLPVNVSDVEDFTVSTGNLLIVRTEELDLDGSETQVGTHGEVGDSGDKGDTGGDVMEDTVSSGLPEGQTGEDERCYSHDSADSEVPIGTANGNGNLSGSTVNGVAVDVKRIVALLEERHDRFSC